MYLCACHRVLCVGVVVCVYIYINKLSHACTQLIQTMIEGSVNLTVYVCACTCVHAYVRACVHDLMRSVNVAVYVTTRSVNVAVCVTTRSVNVAVCVTTRSVNVAVCVTTRSVNVAVCVTTRSVNVAVCV